MFPTDLAEVGLLGHKARLCSQSEVEPLEVAVPHSQIYVPCVEAVLATLTRDGIPSLRVIVCLDFQNVAMQVGLARLG